MKHLGEHRELWAESPTLTLGRVVKLDLPEGFQAVHGGRLETIQLSYECWGELNPARDNAVLISHTLASDCHATGDFRDEPVGWWEGLIGPGRAIDTDRWFVVCPTSWAVATARPGRGSPRPTASPTSIASRS